jgi:hypothetical protein
MATACSDCAPTAVAAAKAAPATPAGPAVDRCKQLLEEHAVFLDGMRDMKMADVIQPLRCVCRAAAFPLGNLKSHDRRLIHVSDEISAGIWLSLFPGIWSCLS